MFYASIDIETTGLDHRIDQILEIGCVIDNLDEKQLSSPPTFHAYIAHSRITGNPFAIAMNAEIIKIIAEGKHPDLMTPQDACEKLAEFMTRWCGSGLTTCAGKNFQGFDRKFLDKMFEDNDAEFKVHHRCFDPATSFYRTGDKTLPDLKLCLERANIDLPFKLHTAVDDAKAVIALLRSIHSK
jgi:oligoribonuclease (3'-5' exoribonuclease)